MVRRGRRRYFSVVIDCYGRCILRMGLHRRCRYRLPEPRAPRSVSGQRRTPCTRNGSSARGVTRVSLAGGPRSRGARRVRQQPVRRPVVHPAIRRPDPTCTREGSRSTEEAIGRIERAHPALGRHLEGLHPDRGVLLLHPRARRPLDRRQRPVSTFVIVHGACGRGLGVVASGSPALPAPPRRPHARSPAWASALTSAARNGSDSTPTCRT
jgi:hypothetical protein